MNDTRHSPPNNECGRLTDVAVLPDEPPEWLATLMEPLDEWAARHIQPHEYSAYPAWEDITDCRSWKRAYALMPKSQREWEVRLQGDPPRVDRDGAAWDRGLRGLSRRLFTLHAVEGNGVAADVHPLCAMERLLCLELAERLACEVPRSWPDDARLEHGQRIAECRGLLYCFAIWRGA